MSLASNDTEEKARVVAERLLVGTPDADHHQSSADPGIEAAANLVAEHWLAAAKSLVLACFHLVAGMHEFAQWPERLDAFFARLVAKRVLSENDVLSQLKANGKLAMLKKIGRHAETLMSPTLLPLLPAHYSLIYQICLLIEEAGQERAEIELSKHNDITRDDVVKIRAALQGSPAEQVMAPAAALDPSAAQLFALRPTPQDLRVLVNDYVGVDTLDRCLRRPPPADDAGLVAVVPLLTLGAFQRSVMPLLGFNEPNGLLFETPVDTPDITRRDVIIVAKRGKMMPKALKGFPSELGHRNVLSLADALFPSVTAKCQPFALARSKGWTALIGDENWHERPTLR